MSVLRACLHRGGGPQVGEVTCGGSPHLPCKRDKTKMRNYMNRWITPPKRVTSPTWGPPPPCKQALSGLNLEKCRGFFPQGKAKQTVRNNEVHVCEARFDSSYNSRRFYRMR